MTWTPLGLALDELTAAVAGAAGTPADAAALAAVVLDLERAAGSALGGTASDPQVVLVRRFARAHRLLLRGQHTLDLDQVRTHVLALRDAEDPGRTERTTATATAHDRSTVEA